MKKVLFVFLSCLVLFSCEKEDPCQIDNLTGTYNRLSGDELTSTVIVSKSGNNLNVQIIENGGGNGVIFDTSTLDCQFTYPIPASDDKIVGVFDGNTLNITRVDGDNDIDSFWMGSK